MGHPDSGRLQTLMDGEMPDAEARELRSHLTECVSCRQAMEALKDASDRASLVLPLLDAEPALEEAAVPPSA